MPAEPYVVVTGSSGFIGRALVSALQRRKARVLGIDLNPFPNSSLAGRIGDLTDPAVARGLFDPKPDVVFHLAARTSVVLSAKDPQGVYEQNVAVTQALLEGCRLASVPAFVMASTNAVVGQAPVEAFDELSPLQPLTPYGATKAADEMLCWAYAQSYGLRAAAVRLTNVYGPGMAGKDSFIIRLLRSAVSGKPIALFGDGRQQRDYLYVDDAVDALLLAWDRQHRGPLVVGAGSSVDLFEVHKAACAATGISIPFEQRPGPPGEMRAVRVNLKLAKSLGFQPRYDLTAGLNATWQALRPELTAGADSR